MSVVGMFAGRGDVVLSMGLALVFGLWGGWQLKTLWIKVRKPKSE